MAEIESPSAPDVAVVLVTADWAGPARPAETVLRELSRRWGDTVRAVVVDASQDEMLDLLSVDVVPTWLRFIKVTDQVTDSPGGLGETASSIAAGAVETREAGPEAAAAAQAEAAAEAAAVETAAVETAAAGTGAAHPGAAESLSRPDEHLVLRDLPVTSSTGEHTVMAGTWRLMHRRTGALPKHEIAREFGPTRTARPI